MRFTSKVLVYLFLAAAAAAWFIEAEPHAGPGHFRGLVLFEASSLVAFFSGMTLLRRWLGRRAAQDVPGAPPDEEPGSVARTGIIFLGGLANSRQASGPFLAEHTRQYAEELKTKAPLASLAAAVCIANGQIGVQLMTPPPAQEVLWTGVVGQIPIEYLPRSAVWSLEAIREAEPIVRTVVAAALAYQ